MNSTNPQNNCLYPILPLCMLHYRVELSQISVIMIQQTHNDITYKKHKFPRVLKWVTKLIILHHSQKFQFQLFFNSELMYI